MINNRCHIENGGNEMLRFKKETMIDDNGAHIKYAPGIYRETENEPGARQEFAMVVTGVAFNAIVANTFDRLIRVWKNHGKPDIVDMRVFKPHG